MIFFQDCIQEEDITNVLTEVSPNGYKIHFQVGVLLALTKIASLQHRNVLRRQKREKKVGVLEKEKMAEKMQTPPHKPRLQLLGTLTSILELRFR